MIKPINISPINTTTQAHFECESCGASDIINITNKVINTDDKSDLEYLNSLRCPNCDSVLGKSNT